MRFPSSMTMLTILAPYAGLWAAPAAAHPPDECRKTLANFARHAGAFEGGRAVTGPVLPELFAAWDKVEESGNHARWHAVIYRHFVADFPRLRTHLSAEAESSAAAIHWARRAIFCLKRDPPAP